MTDFLLMSSLLLYTHLHFNLLEFRFLARQSVLCTLSAAFSPHYHSICINMSRITYRLHIAIHNVLPPKLWSLGESTWEALFCPAGAPNMALMSASLVAAEHQPAVG